MGYELTEEERAAYEAEFAEIDAACEERRADDDQWEDEGGEQQWATQA